MRDSPKGTLPVGFIVTDFGGVLRTVRQIAGRYKEELRRHDCLPKTLAYQEVAGNTIFLPMVEWKRRNEKRQ